MVDVGAKAASVRRAVAESFVSMSAEAFSRLDAANVGKGDVLATARVAGIMAAKRTSELIPLCHPLPLSGVDVEVRPADDGYEIEVRVRTVAQTAVEMEALTAVAVTALTIYDMVKAVDREMVIDDVRLVAKRGGRSGSWVRRPAALRST